MINTNKNILVVEDDSLIAKKMKIDIEALGFSAVLARSFEEAERKLRAVQFKLALIDIDLGGEKTGLDLISSLKKNGIQSIMTTGHSSPETIETAYSLGCDNYLTKPCTQESLKNVIDGHLSSSEYDLRFEQYLKKHFTTVNDSLIKDIQQFKDGALKTNVPVLLQGPTGTGKTTLARAVHFGKFGSDENFFELNCSTIKTELAESLLFGHKKGSFSDAKSDYIGIVEKANGGTLFLDEIGTLPFEVQNKLLKVLEEKKFFPLGSTSAVSSNFRLISATKDNLLKLIHEGSFRDDLFYRISGANLQIPSLSERKDDIEFFINKFSQPEYFGRAIVIKPDALELLRNYSWPGNVRQIKKFFDSRKNMKIPIVTRECLPIEITNKMFKHNQDLFLSPAQLDFIENYGLNEFLEKAKSCAVSTFREGAKSHREAARRMRTTHQLVKNVMERHSGDISVR